MNIELSKCIFRITIPDSFLRRLWILSRASWIEISGIGEVEVRRQLPNPEEQEIVIRPVLHLIPQSGNFVNTVLNTKDIAQMLIHHVAAGKDPELLRFWYHSHINMPVFFSEQDEATLDQLARNMPLVVAAVFNHFGDSQWRIVLENKIVIAFNYFISGALPSKSEIAQAKEELDPLVTYLEPTSLDKNEKTPSKMSLRAIHRGRWFRPFSSQKDTV